MRGSSVHFGWAQRFKSCSNRRKVCLSAFALPFFGAVSSPFPAGAERIFPSVTSTKVCAELAGGCHALSSAAFFNASCIRLIFSLSNFAQQVTVKHVSRLRPSL